MVPGPVQIGENATDTTVPQQKTEEIDLYPGFLEEEDEILSGTVSNGDSGSVYIGKRIKTRDNIIQECVGIYLVIVQQHSSQGMNRKEFLFVFPSVCPTRNIDQIPWHYGESISWRI